MSFEKCEVSETVKKDKNLLHLNLKEGSKICWLMRNSVKGGYFGWEWGCWTAKFLWKVLKEWTYII